MVYMNVRDVSQIARYVGMWMIVRNVWMGITTMWINVRNVWMIVSNAMIHRIVSNVCKDIISTTKLYNLRHVKHVL